MNPSKTQQKTGTTQIIQEKRHNRRQYTAYRKEISI